MEKAGLSTGVWFSGSGNQALQRP